MKVLIFNLEKLIFKCSKRSNSRMSYFEILELSDSKHFVTTHPIFLDRVHFKTTLTFIRLIFIYQIDILKLRLLKKFKKKFFS